jgi:cytochrome P450
MAGPVTRGRWPALGHPRAPLRRGFGLGQGLRTPGELVLPCLGSLQTAVVTTPEPTRAVLVAASAKFRKGVMFDKFRPFVRGGPVNSEGAFHLRRRRLTQPAFHRERIVRHTDTARTAVAASSESWRPGGNHEINEDFSALAITIPARRCSAPSRADYTPNARADRTAGR